MGLKAAVGGLGYFQGDFIGLDGTIRSSERHPDKLGGWAYDSFTNLEGEEVNKTAKMFEIALLVTAGSSTLHLSISVALEGSFFFG